MLRTSYRANYYLVINRGSRNKPIQYYLLYARLQLYTMLTWDEANVLSVFFLGQMFYFFRG